MRRIDRKESLSGTTRLAGEQTQAIRERIACLP